MTLCSVSDQLSFLSIHLVKLIGDQCNESSKVVIHDVPTKKPPVPVDQPNTAFVSSSNAAEEIKMPDRALNAGQHIRSRANMLRNS